MSDLKLWESQPVEDNYYDVAVYKEMLKLYCYKANIERKSSSNAYLFPNISVKFGLNIAYIHLKDMPRTSFNFYYRQILS